MSKCRESVIHNQECMQQHKEEYGVSNSSLDFERLRTQERIAERSTKETVSNARQKTLTQVQHIVMNSQKATQQQYTDTNVDVRVNGRHTDGAENRKLNRFQSHVRAEGDNIKSQRHVSMNGTRVSTLTRRATRAD